jgi:hypothetical protein
MAHKLRESKKQRHKVSETGSNNTIRSILIHHRQNPTEMTWNSLVPAISVSGFETVDIEVDGHKHRQEFEFLVD